LAHTSFVGNRFVLRLTKSTVSVEHLLHFKKAVVVMMAMWQRRQYLRCPVVLAVLLLLLLPLESLLSRGCLVQAFTPSTTTTNVAFRMPASSVATGPFLMREAVALSSSTALADKVALRTWNLNREAGSSPFGLDLNAEVWNGRVAQVRRRLRLVL
jgi:hypothetical protein